MATVYLDSNVIQELASRGVGLDALPTTNTYILTDVILNFEILDTNLRSNLLQCGQETGSLRIENVLDDIDLFDPVNAQSYGVRLNPDGLWCANRLAGRDDGA